MQTLPETQLPPVGDLINRAMDFGKVQIGPLFMAGLGWGLPFMAMLLAVMAPLFLAMIPGIITEDDAVIAIGLVAGFALYIPLLLLLIFVATPLMQGSFYRSLDEALDGTTPLGPGAAWRHIRHDATGVLICNAIVQGAVIGGSMLCWFPGIIAFGMLHLALPLAAVRGVPPIEACKMTFEHAKADPGWHIAVLAITWVVGMVLAYVPFVGFILGIPFIYLMQVIAMRAAFPRQAA